MKVEVTVRINAKFEGIFSVLKKLYKQAPLGFRYFL
jgi:hypothetical protein